MRNIDRDIRLEERQNAGEDNEVVIFDGWLAPEGAVRDIRNSWLYVPLLLSAAGMLSDHSRATWESHSIASQRWREWQDL